MVGRAVRGRFLTLSGGTLAADWVSYTNWYSGRIGADSPSRLR